MGEGGPKRLLNGQQDLDRSMRLAPTRTCRGQEVLRMDRSRGFAVGRGLWLALLLIVLAGSTTYGAAPVLPSRAPTHVILGTSRDPSEYGDRITFRATVFSN